MYHIHFQLPNSIGAPYVRGKVFKELATWKELYGIPYKCHSKDSTLIVELALDKDATWFALTWTGRAYYKIEQV